MKLEAGRFIGFWKGGGIRFRVWGSGFGVQNSIVQKLYGIEVRGGYKAKALKGRHLSAQGVALGIRV